MSNPSPAQIIGALQSLRPGAAWSLPNVGGLADLEWIDTAQPRPSNAEVELEVARLAAIGPVPQQISDRQFAQALKDAGVISFAEALAFVQTGTIPPALQATVDAITDQETREAAMLLLAGATVFERVHPMTEALRGAMGWSAEQTDDLWRAAAEL